MKAETLARALAETHPQIDPWTDLDGSLAALQVQAERLLERFDIRPREGKIRRAARTVGRIAGSFLSAASERAMGSIGRGRTGGGKIRGVK